MRRHPTISAGGHHPDAGTTLAKGEGRRSLGKPSGGEVRQNWCVKTVRDYDPDRRFAPQIVDLARSAQLVVLALPDRAEGYWLSRFPKESCSNVSYIVGYIMLERGYGDWAMPYDR